MSISELLKSQAIEREAKQRYTDAYSDAQFRAGRYEKYHKFFSPAGGDQWPEDLGERPGKLHISANIIRRFVDTEARLLAIRPRITIPPSNDREKDERGEATEKLFTKWLDTTGFDEWSFTFNQVKSLYGLGVLKVFWNDTTKAPDVSVVEQPQNIMFGWADSNFLELDWAIYHYRISRRQAKRLYGDKISDEMLVGDVSLPPTDLGGGDHEDPVDSLNLPSRAAGRTLTDYERSHVPVWDYWYLDEDGKVMNAILVNGHTVSGPHEHNEMPAIPYIPVESDHEPGSPDGHGIAELLLDIQMGMNRATSHYAQHVWDTTDPAYQLTGPEAPQQVPPGLVPKGGELVAPGPGVRIEEVRSTVNNFPFDSLIQQYWNMAHRMTGLSEILFGVPPGAQTSARALQAQLDSSINSLSPKRDRYYTGLTVLLKFWHYMAMQKNPKIDTIGVKDIIDGLSNWRIVAPEITPRDVIEHVTNVSNKVAAKLISLETAMDEVGVDNPLEEIERIKRERSDAHLFPGDAQSIAAVMATLQALEMQAGAQGAAAEGENAQAAAQQDAQEAQPALFEDQNGIATGPDSPPPSGASSPIGGELRPIVRESGGSGPGAMSELRLPVREF